MRPPILIAWAVLIFLVGWQFGRPGPLSTTKENCAEVSAPGQAQHEAPNDLKQKLEAAHSTILQQREVIDQLRSQEETSLNSGEPTPEQIADGSPPEKIETSPSEDAISSTFAAPAQEPNFEGKSGRTDQSINLLDNMKLVANAEAKTSETERLRAYKKFLKQVEISAINLVETKLKSFDRITPEIEQYFGRYRGSLNFLQAKRKAGRISLLIQQPSEKPYRAAVRVDVVDGVKDKTTVFGGVNLLKRYPGQSTAIFIESSDQTYLQLYFLAEESVWIGNLYEKASDGSYMRVGLVKLEKLDGT
jgi:hypothetical protein